MFVYCENKPVMGSDPQGHHPLRLIINIVKAAATINDMYQLSRKDGKGTFISEEKSNDENVHITNSYKIITPEMQYEVSKAVNHSSKYGNTIRGTSRGIQYEWMVHNIAYYATSLLNSLGIDTGSMNESAKDVDVGHTIFDDDHGALSIAMNVGYATVHPFHALYDLISYLRN